MRRYTLEGVPYLNRSDRLSDQLGILNITNLYVGQQLQASYRVRSLRKYLFYASVVTLMVSSIHRCTKCSRQNEPVVAARLHGEVYSELIQRLRLCELPNSTREAEFTPPVHLSGDLYQTSS